MNTNNTEQHLIQLELFKMDEIETCEAPHKTTIQDLIRELKSVYVEVDIALDYAYDDEPERIKETLCNLAERLEIFIDNIRL